MTPIQGPSTNNINFTGLQNPELDGTGKTNDTKGVGAILDANNVTFTNNVEGVDGAGNTSPAAELPELEEPTKQQGINEALDKLLSILQLENDKVQVNITKQNLAIASTMIEAEHTERSAKLTIALSLLEQLGDRWILFGGSAMRNEAASIAAFSAAIVALAPEEKTAAAFMLANSMAEDARWGHHHVFFWHGDRNNTLYDGLKAMGFDRRDANAMTHLIQRGRFDIAAKISGDGPLAEILDKAQSYKETAKKMASLFNSFGDVDMNKLTQMNRSKALAAMFEEIIKRRMGELGQDDDKLSQIIELVKGNVTNATDILASLRGSTNEISENINQMV